MSGEDAGEQPNGGAGIFRVEGARSGLETSQAMTSDADGGVVDFDRSAERFHAAKGAVAIASSGEIAKFGGAVGQGAEHGVAMRDGFVAGRLDGAVKRCTQDEWRGVSREKF